jgi:hypothetical protein
MKQAINFIISGIVFVDAETHEEAEEILDETSIEELIDNSEKYTVIYHDVPLYEN